MADGTGHQPFHPQGPCEGGIMAHSPRPDPLRRCPAEQQQYLGGRMFKRELGASRLLDSHSRRSMAPDRRACAAARTDHSPRARTPRRRASEREGPRLVSRTHADDAPAIQQFNLCSMAHALQNFDIWVRWKGGLRLWKVVVWTRFVAVIGGVGYRGGNIYHPHWRCILHQRTGRLGGLNKYFSSV